MNSVIYLKAMTDPSVAPCFVLVDIQKEYVAGTRLMSMPELNGALENCHKALVHARAMGFPVAYVRQKSKTSFFNPGTSFFNWITGFEPTGSDMVFDRDKPSCYSNKLFSELMEGSGGHFVFAGFAGETACLSTAVDAYHRGHRFTYLGDASASHRLGKLSAQAVQEAITEIIGTYGEVADTCAWVTKTSNQALVQAGGYHEK